MCAFLLKAGDAVTCGACCVDEIWGLRLELCQAALYGVWLISTLIAGLFLNP
jgi:hypothetical protein